MRIRGDSNIGSGRRANFSRAERCRSPNGAKLMYRWVMTNPSAVPDSVPPLETGAPSVERRDRNIALVAALLLLIGMPIGWLPGSTSDVIGLIVIGLAVLGIMGGLILWLAPRERLAQHAA